MTALSAVWVVLVGPWVFTGIEEGLVFTTPYLLLVLIQGAATILYCWSKSAMPSSGQQTPN